MKYSLRWYLLALSFLFPLSLQAKTDEAQGQEKVCFCHNVDHNPHTICTANPALIQAHMDHVNGEVPGVMDSLGECESEPDPSDMPDDGGEGEGDPGEETPEDEGNTPEEENPDDSEDESGDAGDGDVPDNAQVLDDGETGAMGGGALTYMEGSGCSLNPTATGSAGGALAWGLMATLPLWRRRRR